MAANVPALPNPRLRRDSCPARGVTESRVAAEARSAGAGTRVVMRRGGFVTHCPLLIWLLLAKSAECSLRPGSDNLNRLDALDQGEVLSIPRHQDEPLLPT
jgi:hypothetical protein